MYRCIACNKFFDKNDLFLLPDYQMMVHVRDSDSIHCVFGHLDCCGPVEYSIDREKVLGIPCS